MDSYSLNSAQLTDAAVAASVAGKVCAVCGYPKPADSVFCPTDWHALPLPARWELQDGAGSPGFTQNFRAWLRHLQLNSNRAVSMASTPGEAPYRTLADWTAAGYSFSRHGQCDAPRCLRPIIWLITPAPNPHYLAIDGPGQPARVHRATCADPGFFERRRQRREEARRAKTSARRRRAS